MSISDLSPFFSNRCVEFEIQLDEIGNFKVGDFISITSEDVVLVKRIQGNADDYAIGKFATMKYKNDFEEKSHGKTCCQISGITGNFLEISMLYDLRVKYDQAINEDGIVIAALDNAVKGTPVSELNTILAQNYSVNLNNENYYLIGKYGESEKENTFILVDPNSRRFFAVSSKKFAEIDPEEGSSTDSSYVIDAPERPLNHIEKYSFYLYGGSVRFEDKSKLHRLSEITKAFIANGGNEYVNRWRHYAEKQMELEQQLHDDAGYLNFKNATVERAGYYRFYVTNANLIQNFLKKARKENGKIQVLIEQPSQFSGGRSKKHKALMTDKIPSSMGYVECSFESEDEAANFNPTLSGTIEVDLSGSIAVYNRRMQAFDLIQRGDSANGALLYMLDGRTVNTYSKKELNDSIHLDENIIKRFFEFPPNPSQRRAIEIALHTPDIAVIQGPPGTGKTKVIQTIYAHLQAKQKNSDAASDKYLLTAYQRDATQNMADGVDQKFDLPIISYLGGGVSNASINFSLKQWCDEKAKYVTESNENLEYYTAKKSDIIFVNEVLDIICGNCSFETAQSLLSQVVEKARVFVDRDNSFIPQDDENNQQAIIDSIEKVEHLLRKLERRVSVEKMPDLLFYAKIIPTSKPEMNDMGLELVHRIIEKLSCLSFEQEFVRLLNDLKFAAEKSDYKMLCSVKTALILTISNVRDLYDGEKEEIAKVLKPLAEAMKSYRLSEKQEIISEYLYSLFPGSELQDTIAKYQQIIAATHQLSSEHNNCKDILIDEAARSCPADLMIPLSKAENRIILVGDHKQLPQYIEDEVLKTIYPTSDENAMFHGLDEKAIKEKYECSMFEYLIEKAKSLSARDPSHERVVQLNVQYRMPPVIGSIVSKHFYDGTLNNPDPPLPDEHYQQNMPGIEKKNLVWIDLSKSGTSEKRSASGSRYRQCEVDTIAKYIKIFAESGRWNRFDTRKENRIGVITFYSKQRELIREKLISELGMELANMIEVGTVDSFQGKEFGIVFLSLVRNNDFDDVGFLSSSNRMCVALSRSIKCLVVVGSSRILKYSGAKKKIPALIDVYQACKNKVGGVCELLTE